MKRSLLCFSLLLAAAMTVLGVDVVYENDFESYPLGEVRVPVGEALPFMQYNEATNTVHCEIESDCGVDGTKGLHAYCLKEEKNGTGGAQFNTGLKPEIFSQPCEICYSAFWQANNLGSLDITDGTNLFFRLMRNGGTAYRGGVTNKATYAEKKKVNTIGGADSDPDRVGYSDGCTYVIHVLFPEGRISVIDKVKSDGTVVSYPQPSYFGVPGVLPTHFGGGLNTHNYAAGNRNSYVDDMKVTCEIMTQPRLGANGVTRVKLQDSDPILNVSNDGTGVLNATVEVLEGSGFFSFREDEEQLGTFSVDVEGQMELHTVIDREILGNAFGRAKVRVSGAGEEKIFNYTIQNGNPEEGYTLYDCDFDCLELGDILVSEPLWVKSGTVEDCNVVTEATAGQCLEMVAAKALHLNINMPSGTTDKFDVKVSSRVMLPFNSTASVSLIFGADLDHRQGEYRVKSDENTHEVYLSLDDMADKNAVTNRVPQGEWFDFSYTYSTDPANRVVKQVVFGDCTYELTDPIVTAEEPDFFNQLRFRTYNNEGFGWYIDDLKVELVPRGQGKPPVVKVAAADCPVPYTQKNTAFMLFNDGGGSYTYTAEVVEGSGWLKLSKSAGTVESSDTITCYLNRAKMDEQFYVGKVKITTDAEGYEEQYVNIQVQSGTVTGGYVLYQSDFNSLQLTTEEEGQVVNELSTQDACWLPTSNRNRADVVADPDDPSNLCVSIREARRDSKGYHLALNVPAEACEKYDVAYSMRVRIPASYVDSETQTALFCIGQDDASRQCEVYLYLDEDAEGLPVGTDLHDLYDTEWWNSVKDTIKPISHDEWFDFRLKFNCKTYDYFYKELRSYTFGENEFHFEGEDAQLGKDFTEKQLLNEALAKVKFWSYLYDAQVLIDDVRITLVPKGVPEPATLGLLALLGLLFLRRK